ncbi:MAG: CoA pyrophosphatase [Gammaproteobacteria bacterium]|nr:CoA pyrophosphatase [Gammaproteobacteria bacterium]
MSSQPTSSNDVLLQRVLSYFARVKQQTPQPIAHPDATVNRLAIEQLESLRRAAVLIPITRADEFNESQVVLTVRSANLKSHAGQISLPGGSQDARDADVYATALRESEEEIGLPPSKVEIIGRLGELALPSGFRVTPIIGLIDSGLQFSPCPLEVADIFHAPLSLVMNPHAYRSTEIHYDKVARKTLELTYEDYRIWGATAAILHHLALQVFKE